MRTKLLAFFTLFMSGCCLFSPRTEQSSVRENLDDVVDAVQWAVDAASTDDAWKASNAEFAHWSAACKETTNNFNKQCAQNATDADALCRAKCSATECGRAEAVECQPFKDAKNRDWLCSGSLGSKQTAWCASAKQCVDSTTQASQLCKNVGYVRAPILTSAELSVAVAQNTQAGGNASFLVVTLGASVSRAATNTVTLDFIPRVRSTDYGVANAPARPQDQVISPNAQKLGAHLKDLIIAAIESASRQQAADAAKSPQRPPLVISKLEVDFALVVDASGQLGLKATLPNGLGLGASGSDENKRTNSLKIIYAQPPDETKAAAVEKKS